MADPTPLGRRAAEKSDAKDKDASGEWAKPYRQQPPAQPVLDWGATVYLSNDDSMSLASAQRLLWAVDRGAGFSSGEVRPHELLNYFSFDTAPVAPGETFSVLGGAEQDGDTLSVALAVQGAMPPRQPLDLTLVIGRYAQAWHLPANGATLTEAVQAWRTHWPYTVALPPRNGRLL